MKLDLLTPEAKEKFEAARAVREARAAERTKAHDDACRAALEEVDYDPGRLVVRDFPSEYGGGWVLRKPDAGYYSDVEKRFTAAGKDAQKMQIIAAEVVQNPKLLVHPSLGELHEARRRYPGVYTTILGEWMQACSGEGNG